MGYKLIALDIDGTIRSNEYPLSPRTRQAVSRVVEAGAVVTLATGRTFQSAMKASSELNINAPIASSQGAQVTEPATGKVLRHRPLEPEMARAALAALSQWDMTVMAFHGDQVLVSQLTPWLEKYGQRNGIDIVEVGDLEHFAADELTRLVVMGGEDEACSLARELKAKFNSSLYVTRSLPDYCEVLHPDGGKEKALAWLCSYFGIDEKQTLAFGNGYNDVQMLDWAGLGVAIGGAVPEALEAADIVAPPLEEDGAAQVLEELLGRGLIG